MQTVILKLKPNSRFHFGKPAVTTPYPEDATDENKSPSERLVDTSASLTDTDTFVHSDVLFSALVNNLSRVVPQQEDLGAFINAFEDGCIRISSAFYCLEDQAKTPSSGENPYLFLLPRPVDAPNTIDITQYDRIKQVKKVQFVCPQTLTQAPKKWPIAGALAIHESSLNAFKRANPNHKPLNINDIRLFHKQTATQVALHAPNEKAYGPYAVSYVQIADMRNTTGLGVHFYFMYELGAGLSEKTRNLFNLAVNLLPFNGIGGERSSGYGHIEKVVFTDQTPAVPETHTKTLMTLGMLIPQQQDLENLRAYQYSTRGGRRTANSRLKMVRMIHEGALANKALKGSIANISPEHASKKKPHLRYGKAFTISIPSLQQTSE